MLLTLLLIFATIAVRFHGDDVSDMYSMWRAVGTGEQEWHSPRYHPYMVNAMTRRLRYYESMWMDSCVGRCFCSCVFAVVGIDY
mmetsp:Transcript_44428/g.51242  ORF Transcript_44428/g.51242 Transcript_44428/m.51242 type:complete len:84 (-) Transcript_44428:14-265(-)